MDTSLVFGILITMLFSAFFSGMEIAFVASNRMLAEVDKEKDGISQRILSIFFRNPNTFVSTMLVGNNISLVVYGILFAKFFDSTIFKDFDDALRLTLDTILSTIVILFTGEFLPKKLFKKSPNRLLNFFAPFTFICYILLWPISKFATSISHTLLKFVGIKVKDEKNKNLFSKTDLDYLIQSSIQGAKNENDIEEEVKIFQNALEFRDTKVRDCMIPRTEMNAVDINECDTDELTQMFIQSGNSKLIVYDGDIDNIIGYIHSSELFKDADNWKNNIRTMTFVPETLAAQKMMQTFLQQKKNIGVVVDEFGGTAGIISLEDIVEEIFGEIEDEHDSHKYVARQTSKNEYVLSARLEIDKVNELFNLNLPESDNYMTIGGLILHYYQSFPKLGETIKIKNMEFYILKNTMTKIELVKLKIL